jgi:hypothetical protein
MEFHFSGCLFRGMNFSISENLRKMHPLTDYPIFPIILVCLKPLPKEGARDARGRGHDRLVSMLVRTFLRVNLSPRSRARIDQESVMHNAYIIESGDLAAGIVTREKRGFVFHSAAKTFRRLDGQFFDTLVQAQRAAETLRRNKKSAKPTEV